MSFEQCPMEGLIGEVVEAKGMKLEVIGVTEREVTMRLLSFDESARPTHADLVEALECALSDTPLLAAAGLLTGPWV